MRLALREMRRRPGRFAVAGFVLTLLVILLLFLGGLLDGLLSGSTGAIRAQDADAFVFSRTARTSFLRSRIEPAIRSEVESAPGVTAVGGLGIGLLPGRLPGELEATNFALIGYELGSSQVPDPPAPGTAYGDARLSDLGAKVGDTVTVGPRRTPITIVGFVDNSRYLLQNSLWVEPATWRAILAANRPDLRLADDVFQVLTVRGTPTAEELGAAIDRATKGSTETLSTQDAVYAIPGAREQESTFLQIIYTTLAIAAAVVALFFSLLTLERTPLYGVLKALGASSRQLFLGVAAQAVVVSLAALVLGGGITLALAAAIPPQVPLMLTASRALFVVAGVLTAGVAGSVVSLRRVVRIDPASAIGSGS